MEIRQATGQELREIKKIYLDAFPKKERKPFLMMKNKAKKGEMEILSILDGKRLVGLAITVLHRDLALLDYFAMSRDTRGMGYGSSALEMLKRRYEERKFFLEIELPMEEAVNQRERIRRKRFYLQNGMKETGIRALVFQVPMEVLTAGKEIRREEYEEIYRSVIGPAFRHFIKSL